MMDVPEGTTHFSDFYGIISFYKRYAFGHLNQVSEEWETRTHWLHFERGSWAAAGAGFSDRKLKPIREYF